MGNRVESMKKIDDDNAVETKSSFELSTVREALALEPITDKTDVKPSDESMATHKLRHYWTAVVGILSAVSSGICLAFSDVFTVISIDKELSPAQLLLVKSILVFIISVAILTYNKVNPMKLSRRDLLLNIMKGLFENGAFVLFYYALDIVGMGDATSIVAGALPISTSLFACVLLKENYRFQDLISLSINCAGILLISRPEFIFGSNPLNIDTPRPNGIGYAFAVLAAVGLAIGTICSRIMTDRMTLLIVIFYNGLTGAILTGILVYPTSSERMPRLVSSNPVLIAFIAGNVVLYVAYLYLYNKALQLQTASKTSLLLNVALIISFVSDALVFHTHVLSIELIGAALIFLSSCIVALLVWIETKRVVQEETKLLSNKD
ncbi:solute carrier family 35 member G1-like [Saccoglossus kowalevskii]|uniref:Solute carrier family 35 member G1-like n=1 Tax=Saccoglossus kowalevskii TaxID=10224 RepID=A0ABM0MF30_SACKO|nr:PREDICTED: solute carrier family 35 member G1-like [Saccoglossus kowalevskii]